MYSIFTPGDSNWSNGLIQYEIVDLDELEPKQVLFEIQAESGEYNSFEGLSTVNPLLYAYYSDSGSIDGYDYSHDLGVSPGRFWFICLFCSL